ncbi:MAG: transposase [Pseudomonadota bacterium]
MPLVIDNPTSESCSLPEAIEALADLNFDPRDEGNGNEAALWLRRLTNNRRFLANALIDRLTGRLVGKTVSSANSEYGPQAIILSGLRGSMFLRANIWPAPQDLCFKTSGAANFVYDVPHDHNFSFLTAGYVGPGYRSDYYEYDYENVVGYPGEPAGLRFVERSALYEGKVMLYRAHVDVHSQLPPEALSVSLNVMHVDPAQGWFDQYAFDLERNEVARVLSPNATEAFLRVAVASGTDDALDYAQWVGEGHPSERLRLASFEARAGLLDQEGRDALWRKGEQCGSRMVAKVAEQRRAALAS